MSLKLKIRTIKRKVGKNVHKGKKKKPFQIKFSNIGEHVYIRDTAENKYVFSEYVLGQKGVITGEENNDRFKAWVFIRLDNGCRLKINSDDLDFVKFIDR